MGRLFATLRYYVCCVLHRFSQVMCLLPGSGRRPQRELHPDGAGFVGKQHRSRRGKGLVFGEDGVMRGVGVKKYRKRGSRHRRMKVTLGKDGRQCNAALVPRCIYRIETCDDK